MDFSKWTNVNNYIPASTSKATAPTSTANSISPATPTKKDGPRTVYYLGILRTAEGQPSVELVTAKDLSTVSFFSYGTYNEGTTFTAKTLSERMKPGERSTIDENTGKVHAYKTSFGFCAVLITECDYDRLTGQAVLSKTADAFKSRFTATEIREKDPSSFAWPEIKDLRKEAEAPTGMEAIRKELDETKMVLHQTIASVLERGEKLDTLVAKSEDLTLTSKTFYKGAKQQNGCCAIM